MKKRVIDKHPAKQEPFVPLTDREIYLTLINTYIVSTFYLDGKLEEGHILKDMLVTNGKNMEEARKSLNDPATKKEDLRGIKNDIKGLGMEAYMIKKNIGQAAHEGAQKIGVCEALSDTARTFARNRFVYRLAGNTSKI